MHPARCELENTLEVEKAWCKMLERLQIEDGSIIVFLLVENNN